MNSLLYTADLDVGVAGRSARVVVDTGDLNDSSFEKKTKSVVVPGQALPSEVLLTFG